MTSMTGELFENTEDIELQKKLDNKVDLFLSGFEEYWDQIGKPFSYILFDYIVKNTEAFKYISFEQIDNQIDFEIDVENIIIQFRAKIEKKSIYDINVPVESYFDDVLNEIEQKDKSIFLTNQEYFNNFWYSFTQKMYDLLTCKFHRVNELYRELDNDIECDDNDFVNEYSFFYVIESIVDVDKNKHVSVRKRKRCKNVSHYRTSSKAFCEDSLVTGDSVKVETPDKIAPHLAKYWHQRYRLFSKFDAGILLDDESWYSVTPEKIAVHQSKRCACDIIVDPFSGSGGNIIQFANTCGFVIAGDLDISKLKNSAHNSKIYNVPNVIDYIVADALYLLTCIRADIAFISAPWGGPSKVQNKWYSVETMMEPSASDIFNNVNSSIRSLAMFIPRNSTINELVKLSPRFGGIVEIENNLLNKKVKAKTAYFGEISTECKK